jgi:proteasome activator subunit 4
MAFICNAPCKVHPGKALKRFVPMLIRESVLKSTRTVQHQQETPVPTFYQEIEAWYGMSVCWACVLCMSVTQYSTISKTCSTSPSICRRSVRVSRRCTYQITSITFTQSHRDLYGGLLNLWARCDGQGLSPDDWGWIPKPTELDIKWHVPNKEEIEFAVELFESQGRAHYNTSLP